MIVMDDNYSITSGVNIELNSVDARIQCGFKGQKRILGVSVADAAVRDYFRNAQVGPSGEVLAR